MEKKTYYVALHTTGGSQGAVFENRGDADIQFEIQATEEEVQALREALEKPGQEDIKMFIHSHLPIDVKDGQLQQQYDARLLGVYQMLHRLGTPETRRFIEENIFPDWGTRHPEASPENPAT